MVNHHHPHYLRFRETQHPCHPHSPCCDRSRLALDCTGVWLSRKSWTREIDIAPTAAMIIYLLRWRRQIFWFVPRSVFCRVVDWVAYAAAFKSVWLMWLVYLFISMYVMVMRRYSSLPVGSTSTHVHAYMCSQQRVLNFPNQLQTVLSTVNPDEGIWISTFNIQPPMN